MRFRALSCVSIFAVLITCSLELPTIPSDNASRSAELTIKMGAVGSLAKKNDITLDTLTITLVATGEDSIMSKSKLSGSSQQTVTQTFANIVSLKTWTCIVASKDKTGKTIHWGTTTFIVQPRSTISVTIDLAAMYSMLKANFFPIRDSVNECRLSVDGIAVSDSLFGRTALAGDTVKLAFDYLSSSVSGIRHVISMEARGIV